MQVLIYVMRFLGVCSGFCYFRNLVIRFFISLGNRKIDDEYDASNRLCYGCGCIGLSFMLFFLVFICVSDGR